MTTWKDIEAREPDFARRVRALLDPALGAPKHKTIATLRADGSPRISGIECEFVDGELTFGSMAGSRKGADLRRDPRFALHSATVDPPQDAPQRWPGEAKVAGRAEWTGSLGGDASREDGPQGDTFRADLAEVVWTGLNETGTALVVEFWTEGAGLRRIERA